MSKPIAIDIYSDAVCPWCYLGKRRLEAALRMRPDLVATVRWKPFELNPDLPPEGADRATYIAAKFGDSARFAAAQAKLVELGGEVGIAFRFGQIARVPNTRAAHALVALAGEHADAVVEAIFAAYFERGEDIGELDVLAGAASGAGLDGAALRTRLAAREGFAEVEADEAVGRELGISGVPFFVLAGRWALSGAQEPAQIIAALEQVRDTLAREQGTTALR